MSKYRHSLPQLRNALFLTDGGLETTLVFHEQVELPYFAAFTLLKSEQGTARLRRYFETYTRIALEHNVGIVLEAPTWRANSDWAAKLGYDAAALADANRLGVGLLLELREQFETPATPIVVSGNIGPRGDGYRPDTRMSVGEARDYHAAQIATFAATDADMLGAFTMNYVEEAIGVTLAARAARMPLALSFTLETDGKLPSGQPLVEAIERVDAESDDHPAYYMINCAHPSHFDGMLDELGPKAGRVRGLRANASRRSHAELDASTDLDAGDPHELGDDYRALSRKLPALTVVGGCCGTDHRHVAAIAQSMAHSMGQALRH
ncbi:MAG TPA: homocysteine S-methyltransferase family protein [Steroidobacteraceae bacterium]|nr:homocysteine S-methyltransferase family protein [Steroidobacteraceae bacterium]